MVLARLAEPAPGQVFIPHPAGYGSRMPEGLAAGHPGVLPRVDRVFIRLCP